MTDDAANNPRRPPDPAVCRIKFGGGYLAFSYCLVEKPDCCKYAVRLGSIIFCFHPDRRSFEKTDGP